VTAPGRPHHTGRFAAGVDNKGIEALIRRSPVPLAEEARRAARLAARRGPQIAPVLALSATLALKRGSRVVQLGDWDAAVVLTALRLADLGTGTPGNALVQGSAARS
jgi:hypothetical protein